MENAASAALRLGRLGTARASHEGLEVGRGAGIGCGGEAWVITGALAAGSNAVSGGARSCGAAGRDNASPLNHRSEEVQPARSLIERRKGAKPRAQANAAKATTRIGHQLPAPRPQHDDDPTR